MRRARETNDFPEVQEVLYPEHTDMNPSDEKKQKSSSLADYISSSATNRYANVMLMNFSVQDRYVPPPEMGHYVDVMALDFSSLYPACYYFQTEPA